MPDKKYDEESELEHQTCGALLLQFQEPKVYDLSIPDDNEIYFLVATAVKIINGETTNSGKGNYREVVESPLKEEYFSKFSPRVSKGLINILDKSKRESELSYYMQHMKETLAHEWNMGAGTWFKFRDGKKEEVEKEVRIYFTPLELADFNKLGETFSPYVGMLNLINYSK